MPLTVTEQGGATSADYSGVPASVTFGPDERDQTFTVSATQDVVDDDEESVVIGFGTLSDGVREGGAGNTTVDIRDDDDPAVVVSFGSATRDGDRPEREAGTDADYSGDVTVQRHGGRDRRRRRERTGAPTGVSGTATSTVSITDDDVPASSSGGRRSSDAGHPEPPANGHCLRRRLLGRAGQRRLQQRRTEKSITFSATQDTIDDDGESVRLAFGSPLPTDVTAASPQEAVVSITDDDVPSVTVSFEQGTYTVAEGGTVEVTVTLDRTRNARSPSPSPRPTRALPPTPTTRACRPTSSSVRMNGSRPSW